MTTRREFLALAGSTMALAGCSALPQRAMVSPRKGSTILFQGDSITDNFRARNLTTANQPRALGAGYPFLIASAVLRERPDLDLRFFNRGVSGDRVPQLTARWQTDALDLKPDVLSVLIGVNDFWHIKLGKSNDTAAAYEREYTSLLERTRAALPEVTLIVMEPFVLRIGHVDSSWFPEFDARRAAARNVAHSVGATLVPLQEMFDKLAARTGPADWAEDGVHPAPAGHAAIAQQWRDVVGI